MPDLEDRLWAVLVPVPSGGLEGVTPEKGLRAETAWAGEEGTGQEGLMSGFATTEDAGLPGELWGWTGPTEDPSPTVGTNPISPFIYVSRRIPHESATLSQSLRGQRSLTKRQGSP